MKTKIAIIAPELLPNWGGVGTYCIELVKRLSRDKDLEVHVITLIRRIKGSNLIYDERTISDYFDNKIVLHAISRANDNFLYNFEFQSSILRKVPAIIRDYGINLVHSQHAHMSDILLKMKNPNMSIPAVTTVHSTVKSQFEGIKACNQKWSEMDSSEKYEIAFYYFLISCERLYLSMSRNLIFVSNWTKNHIKTKYPYVDNNGPVIHNGVDPDRFSPKKAENSTILKNISDPIVLYASRITVSRGAHILAHSISKILKSNPRTHFVFAGSGNKKPLVDILKRNNVPKEKYTILGYVDYNDLPALYAKAFAYVMPTSWENLPFKLLEAMSSGVPVITTGVGGIPEVVTNGYDGLIIDRNPKDIAEKIDLLLNDKKLAKNLGENARTTILKRFTWDSTATETKKYYFDRINDFV